MRETGQIVQFVTNNKKNINFGVKNDEKVLTLNIYMCYNSSRADFEELLCLKQKAEYFGQGLFGGIFVDSYCSA